MPVRISPAEFAELDRLRSQGGPSAFGPWLLWAARRGITELRPAARVLPELRTGGVLPTPAIVLDLCSGSGSWSRPYAAAGYDVIRVDVREKQPLDVRSWLPPSPVRGVLAAPPCTEFSLAKNGQPRDLGKGLETVIGCLRVIALAQPEWWALENPVGLLGHWLGAPRCTFQPTDFGDAWTKRTAVWGSFALPAPGAPCEPRWKRPPCARADNTRPGAPCRHAECWSVTPPGFARAFYAANP